MQVSDEQRRVCVANISRRQIGVIAIPIAVIAVLLPVAIVIATQNNEGRNESAKPVGSPLVPAGGPAGSPTPAANTYVRMQNISFIPDNLIVTDKSTIAFVNEDVTMHQVVIDGTDFDSGRIGAGNSSVWTATSPGEHSFRCVIHPNQMHGTITVQGP